MSRAVLEAHVPGRTVKFYGVRGTPFFRSYAEDGSDLGPAPPAWRQLAERAAAVLGLAIYGGDLVVGEAETPVLVDVNDWPSFSRCRAEAAAAIAEHLFAPPPTSPADLHVLAMVATSCYNPARDRARAGAPVSEDRP